MLFPKFGISQKLFVRPVRVLGMAIILVIAGVGILGLSKSRAVDTIDAVDIGYPLRVFKIEATFDDVKFDLENAIVNAGLKIIYHGNIGEMLSRTAAEVGGTKKVYDNAEFYLFCSAPNSHATMMADPRNIAFCPYNLYVYALVGQKETTYVGYRRPEIVGSVKSKAALKALDALLAGMLREVVE